MLYGTAEKFYLEDHLDRTVDVTPKCNVQVHPSDRREPSIEGKTLAYLDERTQSILFVSNKECNCITTLSHHAALASRLFLINFIFLLHLTCEMQCASANFPA